MMTLTTFVKVIEICEDVAFRQVYPVYNVYIYLVKLDFLICASWSRLLRTVLETVGLINRYLHYPQGDKGDRGERGITTSLNGEPFFQLEYSKDHLCPPGPPGKHIGCII